MPLYDYKCDKCGNEEELFKPIDTPTVLDCPKCGGKMKRQFSRPAPPRFAIGGGETSPVAK
jgi:putative FmdB family regulatory protein